LGRGKKSEMVLSKGGAFGESEELGGTVLQLSDRLGTPNPYNFSKEGRGGRLLKNMTWR